VAESRAFAAFHALCGGIGFGAVSIATAHSKRYANSPMRDGTPSDAAATAVWTRRLRTRKMELDA